MAMLARTPAQVVAAEAGYKGSDEARFADMLGIASVIANRAQMLGVTQQQVVGVKSQFNAYKKAMPPGAVSYISMAEQALAEVEENGPVNNATFYATPAAVGNLPSGLKFEDQVENGHKYYSDPKMRSIKTSLGFRVPNKYSYATQIASVPTPEARPDLATAYADPAAAVPTPFDSILAPAPVNSFAEVAAANPIAAPIGVDASSYMGPSPDLAASVNAGLIGVNPSAENFASLSTEASAVATPSSFDMGRFGFDMGRFGDEQANTADFDVGRFGPAPQTEASNFDMGRFGPAISDPNASLSAGMQAQRDYMGASEKTGRLTGDVAQTADPARMAPAESQMASVNAALQNSINQALATPSQQAVNNFADLASAGPVAAGVDANATLDAMNAPDMSAAAKAQIASDPATSGINSPEAKQIQDQAAANLAAMQTQQSPSFTAPASVSPQATAADTSGWSQMANPGMISPAAAYGQMAAYAAPAGITNLSGGTLVGPTGTAISNVPDPNVSLESTTMADTVADTPVSVDATAPSIAAPAVSNPVVSNPVSVSPSSISDPNRSLLGAMAPGTAMGVWSGTATTGTATDGSTVSKMPDGTIGRYSPKFDHTEFTNTDGTWGGVKKGNLLGGAEDAPSTSSISDPNVSLSGQPAATAPGVSRFSNALMSGGTVGSLMGAALGTALAGPIGGLALGMIGQKLGGNYLGDQQPDESPLGALFGLLTGKPKTDTGSDSFGVSGGVTAGGHTPTAPGGGPGSQGSGGYT